MPAMHDRAWSDKHIGSVPHNAVDEQRVVQALKPTHFLFVDVVQMNGEIAPCSCFPMSFSIIFKASAVAVLLNVGFKAQAGKSVDREASGQPVAGSLYHLTE